MLEHGMGIGDHITLTIAINLVIELLKRWKSFPFLSEHSDKVNMCVSYFAAALSAGGIEFGDYSLEKGGIITLPPLQHVISGVASFVTQAGSNEFFYRVTKVLNIVIRSASEAQVPLAQSGKPQE